MAVKEIAPRVDIAPIMEQQSHFLEKLAGGAAVALAFGLGGAVAGAAYAIETPAHVEIAGSDTAVYMTPGKNYNELDFDDLLSFKKGTTGQQVLGENIGVRAHINIQTNTLEDSKGNFSPNILPAYAQLFSDPKQLTSDVESAVEEHFLVDIAAGAGLGFLLRASPFLYRRNRQLYDRRHDISEMDRAVAHAYHEPERRAVRWVAVGLSAGLVLNSTVSSDSRPSTTQPIRGNPLLANTPLADIQIGGLLKPAVTAGESYIEKYVSQTNTYYDRLKKKTIEYLKTNPIALPSDPNVVTMGFVTDRHCNIGMDRVIAAVMKHYNVKILTSAGDDAFSGTFSFESACTSSIAEKSKKAHITDVFGEGNHDSPITIKAEQKQGIQVLQDKIITVDGLNFLGEPDPRTSRYGQGIRPSSAEAQTALVTAQGQRIGEIACKANKKIIVILHDPIAGNTALRDGCGNVTLALDGHIHRQVGPSDITLPGGTTGYQFVGASSGGAPAEGQIESTASASLTVGPLQHEASINLISYDKTTGALVMATELDFMPNQTISTSQQIIDPLYFVLPNGKKVTAR